MRHFLLCIVFAFTAWATAMAVNAVPGFSKVTQSDGTTLMIQAIGDDWYHVLMTADGLVVDSGDDGDYYYVTASGLSTVKAHDVADRNAAELAFIEANKEMMTAVAIEEADNKRCPIRRGAPAKAASQDQAILNSMGSKNIPVLLVNFTDKKMYSGNDVTAFTKHFMTNTYSVNKYFKDQSNGKFNPVFQVYGVYNLPHSRDYYGADSGNIHDRTPDGNSGRGELVRDAVMAALDSAKHGGPQIQWNDFNNNTDSYVDVCIVIYPGVSEAATASTTTTIVKEAIWPLRSSLQSEGFSPVQCTTSGLKVNAFAVFNELAGDCRSDDNSGTEIDGIGTICHEFSHCLGLPDFYETQASGPKQGYFGMSKWDIMGTGNYNNNSKRPIGYSAYEKSFMGWINLETANEPNTFYTLPVFNNGSEATDKAVKITAFNKNEYWILENRQKTKNSWDEFIPASGVLISHYTYVAQRWSDNLVNSQQMQLATIIPADNHLSSSSLSGDTYGYGPSQFTTTSSPAMIANMDTYGNLTLGHACDTVPKPVTEIVVGSDKIASFWYIKGAPKIITSTKDVKFKGFVGKVYSETIDVNVSNVTGNITAELKDDYASVYQATLKQTGNTAQLTITWSPTANGTTSAKVILKANKADDVTINITGDALPATPSLFTGDDVTSLEFSTIPNKTVSKSFDLTGGYITSDVYLTISGSNKFSVEPSHISSSQISEDIPVKVTVSFNSADEGDFNGALTLKSAGNTLLTMDLTAHAYNIGIASDPYLNIANYKSINTVGAAVSGMESIYNFKQDANEAWLTISNYGIAQAAATQKWVAGEYITVKDATWNATDVFSGSEEYFVPASGAKAVTYHSVKDVKQDFYITNCKQVKILANNYSNLRMLRLNMDLYECTLNQDGTLEVGTTAVNNTYNTEEGLGVLAFNNLDPEKIYKVQVTNAKSDLYEIAFMTDPIDDSQPQVDTPVLTVTPSSLSFDTFVDEEQSENFVITGEYVTSDINISSSNGNFTVEPATIQGGIANDENVTVTVTFKPTNPSDNITGEITISSAGAQDQVVTVSGKAKVHAPELTATAQLRPFEAYVGESDSQSIALSGEYVTSDVTLNCSNTAYTVEPATIAPERFANNESVNVTVTFNPQNAGNDINGVLTISTPGAEDLLVNLNGVAFAYPPELNVVAEPMAFMTEVNGEESKTFTISGQYIGGNVTISSDNANFSVNPATIPASEFNSDESVTVAVKFNPLSAGTHNGTITVATPGAQSQSFEVSGIAYGIFAPQIVSDPRAGSDSYKALWTSCPGATSYTLRIMRKQTTPEPDPDPDPEPEGPALLVSDNFSKFTSDGDVDISMMLDNYMQTQGWTGSRLYEKEGGLQMGNNSYVGKLVTPNLDLTNSGGKVSIKMTAYNPASAQQSQYQETSLYVRMGESSNVLTTLHVTRESQEIVAVLDCDEIADQKISFETNGRKYRAILTNIEIYSGDITVTGDGKASITKPIFPFYRDDQTITGIQDTTYTVRQLRPLTTYICDVKAVYGDKESDWSQPVEVVTSLRPFTFDDLIFKGGIGDTFTLIDDLVVVHGNGKDGRLWCKSMGRKPANATEKKEGQVDFLREVTKEQDLEWDQSYWIMLQFPEDDGENGISDLIESAVGKVINGGTITGYYTDDRNYTLEVLPIDDVYSLSLGDYVPYTKNIYCVANFMTSNLNINDGDGVIGLDNVSYFFMNPKIQEVCEITGAKYNGDDMFVVPNNNNHIGGSLNVDWGYNADGQQWPEKGSIYHFTAVVNRMPASDESDDSFNYIVYPLDFNSGSSKLSAINTIYGNCEVVGVEYVNVSGLVSDKPHEGVNIVVTHYRDGSTTVTKSLFK